MFIHPSIHYVMRDVRPSGHYKNIVFVIFVIAKNKYYMLTHVLILILVNT